MKNYVVRVSEMDPGTVVVADSFFVDDYRNLFFRTHGEIVAAYQQWIGVQEAEHEDRS